MWKREETPEPVAPARPAATDLERPEPARATDARAAIGSSITIRGEVTGEEDLLIQGRVEGSVQLKQHSVTVGAEGEVKADITARMVTVEGYVEGNLRADEQITLRSSARVQGDITAPRVVLENGAHFRGGIDMGESLDRSRPATVARPAAAAGESAKAAPGLGVPAPASPGTPGGDDKDAANDKAKGASPVPAQGTR